MRRRGGGCARRCVGARASLVREAGGGGPMASGLASAVRAAADVGEGGRGGGSPVGRTARCPVSVSVFVVWPNGFVFFFFSALGAWLPAGRLVCSSAGGAGGGIAVVVGVMRAPRR